MKIKYGLLAQKNVYHLYTPSIVLFVIFCLEIGRSFSGWNVNYYQNRSSDGRRKNANLKISRRTLRIYVERRHFVLLHNTFWRYTFAMICQTFRFVEIILLAKNKRFYSLITRYTSGNKSRDMRISAYNRSLSMKFLPEIELKKLWSQAQIRPL